MELPMARINIRKMQVNQEGTIASVKVGGELGRRLRIWDWCRGPQSRYRAGLRFSIGGPAG